MDGCGGDVRRQTGPACRCAGAENRAARPGAGRPKSSGSHDRLRPPAAPEHARDLFQFSVPRPSAAPPPPLRRPRLCPRSRPAPPPGLRSNSLASPKKAAVAHRDILNASGQLLLVKDGELVASRLSGRRNFRRRRRAYGDIGRRRSAACPKVGACLRSRSSSIRFPGGVRPEARAHACGARIRHRRSPRRSRGGLRHRTRGHARELTKAAVARGARLVMAWGGDGTINEVASALVFGDVPLGIVPAGSGNGLARQLGISQKPADASARRLPPSPADRRRRDGRSDLRQPRRSSDSTRTSRRNSTRRAPSARIRDVCFDFRPRADDLRAGDLHHSDDNDCTRAVRAVLLTVANSPEFGNGAVIAPRARVDDGLLDLVVEEEVALADDRAAAAAVSGDRGPRERLLDPPNPRRTIESNTPMKFHVDGEPVSGGTSSASASIRARLRSVSGQANHPRVTRDAGTRAGSPPHARSSACGLFFRVHIHHADRAGRLRVRARSSRC